MLSKTTIGWIPLIDRFTDDIQESELRDSLIFWNKKHPQSPTKMHLLSGRKNNKIIWLCQTEGGAFHLKIWVLASFFVKAGFVGSLAFPHLTMGRKNCPNFRWQPCERRELGQEPQPWAAEKRNINTKGGYTFSTGETWYLKRSYSRWWQLKYFLMFIPIWGNDPILTNLFSNGLKPPPSYIYALIYLYMHDIYIYIYTYIYIFSVCTYAVCMFVCACM